ncbi:MAG: DUF3298 domain-containing protein [Lachnospiraceae bacterium]|nr:DUF3298 domain-containing protein [Lachnospiraceae bacterium]
MNQLYGEINKLKQGNFQDYETFYNLTCQYIYKIIKDIVVDDNATAQVLTATYNQIYQTINNLTDNSLFYMWAGRIATDESLKYVNATGNMSVKFEPVGEFYAYQTIFDDKEAFVPENVLSDMEIQRVIQNTIDGLSIGYKIVLQCFYYEGMSINEIAKKLNITEEQVRYAVGYIKSIFRNIINSVPFNNNTKMYSLAQIPVFWIIFKNVLDYATMGVVGGVATGGAVAGTAAMTGGNMAGAGAAVGGSASGGAAVGGMSASGGITAGGAVSGSGGITAGGAVTGGAAGGATATAGGAAGGAVAGSGAAAAGATGTGILATIGGKIALGVAATAILAVGGVAIHNAVTEDDDDDNDNDVTTEQISDASDTDATPTDLVNEETTEEVEQILAYVEAEEIYDIDINRTHTTDPNSTTFWAYCDRIYVESTEYPDLANSVNTWSDESYLQYETDLPSYIDTAILMEENGTDYGTYLVRGYSVARADDSVLSIKCNNDSYMGGPHGYFWIDGVTFDTQTGQILKLDDLGDVKTDLETYITNYIESTEDTEYMYMETISEYIQNDTLSWFLTSEGVYVVFNAYDLAAYAMGSFHIVVPYDKLPGMNEKYVLNNKCGLTQHSGYRGLAIDIDNDGATEYTNFEQTGYDESASGYTGMDVIIGDQTFSITGLNTYQTCVKYVYKAADSTRYLILSTINDAGVGTIYLYTYTKTGVEYLHQIDGFELGYMVGDTLHLTTSINLLGSYQAERLCKIENGQFVFVDDRFILDNSQNNPGRKSVTTKDVLAVKLASDGYMVDGELASGTVIYPANTDNATVLGFYLEDGTYGEIYFETTDSGVLFDGKTEAELFDNIVY